MYNPVFDTNKSIVNIQPDTHRTPLYLAWLRGLLSQSKRLFGIFRNYIKGTEPIVDATYYTNPFVPIVYSKGDVVIYKYKVYQSNVNANSGNTPDISPDYWELIQNSFIGVEESSRFTANKIVLEYAINRYFSQEIYVSSYPGFVQPDDPVTPTPSTIYITNAPVQDTSFVSYTSETFTSLSYTDKASAHSYTNTTFATQSTYAFLINIPTLVYTQINVDPDVAEKIVRNFVDKYVPAGVGYFINVV